MVLHGLGGGSVLPLPVPGPEQGKNLLTVALRGRPASRQDPIRIQGVELLIDYRDWPVGQTRKPKAEILIS